MLPTCYAHSARFTTALAELARRAQHFARISLPVAGPPCSLKYSSHVLFAARVPLKFP